MSRKTTINTGSSIAIDCSKVPKDLEKTVRGLLVQAYSIGYDSGAKDTCEMIHDAIKQYGTVKRKETLNAIMLLCDNMLKQKA